MFTYYSQIRQQLLNNYFYSEFVIIIINPFFYTITAAGLGSRSVWGRSLMVRLFLSGPRGQNLELHRAGRE